MKKIYGFLGAVALLSLASCSKDVEGPSEAVEAKGDFYMSMNITQLTAPGTRTTTGEEGQEVGKDYENKISDAMLFFATRSEGTPTTYTIFKRVEITGSDIMGTDPAVATFEMQRSTFSALTEEGTTYYLFMVTNVNASGVKAKLPAEGTTVQSVLEGIPADNYWTNNNFVMSSAEFSAKLLKASDVAKGTHTTKGEPLQLGSVTVQRIMSRFDLMTDETHTKFTAVAEKPETAFLKNLTVTFDAVALVNMAQTVNLYKEVGDLRTGNYDDTQNPTYTENTWSFFRPETTTNYVFSPEQTSFTYPLFLEDGQENASVTDGNLTGKQVNLETKFSYDKLASIAVPERADNSYTHPNTTNPTDEPNYFFWRYCTENTNYDKYNQYNGNTTGVIFRAELGGTPFTNAAGEPVYAYGNVVLGNADAFKAYVAGNDPGDDVYGFIKARYNAAVDALNAYLKSQGQPEWEAETGTFSALDTYLVSKGFTIYRANENKYYAYYIYWNRHNDNIDNGLMGETEFATVRNNVYKLKVKSVLKLGRPADPNDDPDPDDPGDEDEKEDLWGEVSCEILPWEVRINGIEF